MAHRERMDVVQARETFDQREQHRDHLLAPTGVEPSGDDKRDLHRADAVLRRSRRVA
jgi:hypothetical protein